MSTTPLLLIDISLVRRRIIKQTKLDSELLEHEGIMDYSLFIALQSKEESCHGSLNGLNPVYGSFTPPCTKSIKTTSNSVRTSSVTKNSCSTDGDSIEGDKSMTLRSETSNNSTCLETNQINKETKLTATLNELFLKSSSTNFGMKIPARARRVKRGTREEEWYDVVLYLGIVDTFQDYRMKKRTEHCYKSIQHNSNSISTVHPKIYSSRFQDFVSNIFLPCEDNSL